MNQNTKAWLLTGGALGAAGIGTGIASTILLNRTLPRPKETSQEIINEFADENKIKIVFRRKAK